MSTLTIRLPDSLHVKIREIAHADGISINQFLASAAAEKVSAFLTADYLKQEASRADPAAFHAALANPSSRTGARNRLFSGYDPKKTPMI